MQQALRPYVTAGVALVGASMIAVTPVAAPPIDVQFRAVQLTDAWSDLFTETAANWQNILNGADSQAISEVFSALTTNPVGVLGALANLTPDITTNLSSLPGQITVELPPGLALGIAGLGSWGAGLTAINEVLPDLQSNPANAFEDFATILNGFLNGQDNISLLGGTITIPFWNGSLAPLQSLDVNLSLTNLVDALGLGGLKLTDLNLTSLLSQLGLGNLTVGSLFSDLGLSNDGLGTLLGGSGVTTLGGVLNLLGLNALNLGSFSLTSILSDLGLDANVNLNSLTLDQVLTDFGLNPNVDIGLVGLLDNLGFGTFLNTGLGTELSNLGLLSPILGTVLGALNGVTVGQLLGGQTINESLTNILTALGVGDVTPTGLTIGGLLQDLGFASSTGDLTLGGLLTDLGNPILGLNVTDLLNGLNVGDLLNSLGLSNLPLDLTNLGDVSGLTLGGLLGDLGLGDLANVTVDPLGGLVTELVDVVPQQIVAALGL